MTGQFGLILRLVRREIPQSLASFGVLIACIAIGVGAIVAVTTLSRALDEGLQREGRVILGADAAFTLIQREASPAERAAIARHGTISEVALSRAMARGGDDQSLLVEIKAVDESYPVAGRVSLQGIAGPELRTVSTLTRRGGDGVYGIVADPLLTGRLGIAIGDSVEIGAQKFRVMAHLASEPDKLSGGMGFGPRVIMSREGLNATGLIQPGSLTRFAYRLDAGATDEPRLRAMLDDIAREVPDAGWQVASRTRASPQLQRQVARFTEFMTLVGLTSLLIGGVGVANAARAFADRQVMRVATLKSVGATQSFVFVSALSQVMAFALIGIAAGLVIGVGLPWLAISTFGHLLPYPLVAGVYPGELGLGIAYGLLTTVAFSILPLSRARAVPPSTLFRDAIGSTSLRPSLWDLLMLAGALSALIALAVGAASERRIATIYVISAIATVIALRGVAWGVMRVAARLGKPRDPAGRLALANLHRPGSLTPSVMLSLGLGLTLLVSLTLIDLNLGRQFRAALPGIAPNFFFVDIPSREMDRFEGFLKAEAGGGTIERVPQLRGRLVEVKGVASAEIRAAERISWVLEGDRGITYSATIPEGSTIARGEWWPADYRGVPLVSFAKDIADGLGLDIGDEIVVNVLGRRIRAKVANLREVRWQRLGINFVMVFSPNTFAGAPHTFLATLALPMAANAQQEVTLARNVARSFPAISAVRVKDAIEAVDKIVSQLATAIRASTAIALVSSILVLGGALAATARSRQRDSVILKTLGATRGTLIKAMLIEYAALGAIAVVFGLICGTIGAWFVVTRIMNLEFAIPWPEVVSIAVASFAVTIILGMAGTWRILGQKPAAYLRHA